ncbi:MAG TPA: hypothetical protein PKA82_07150 [Pyrinomonadaceae bacterium]|nr:hypothetical protein [Pyrinomonadaceae bacterium]
MIIQASNIKTLAKVTFAVVALLAFGSLTETNAQRDPFKKAAYQQKRPTVTPSAGGVKKAGPATVPATFGAPAIEARIEYFKMLRQKAAEQGQPLPKVTSVLTVNELAVTGIFKTPRGYAAMVEATPIKLSYTIYPGEKFFDGQLVAVEENRLVFRKVTKTAPGKFVASVENKPLQQYNQKAQIQGTAPTSSDENKTPQVAAMPVPAVVAGAIVSPLDEMNNPQPEAKPTGKKGVKSAKNKK